jgi:thioredoxin-related protein
MSRIAPLSTLALATVLCFSAVPSFAATNNHMPPGIAWQNGDQIDALFKQAQAQNKPIFLYWGAVWCPPCNQVKATIFNRADFIDGARHFIPVYLDGDSPGAQRLGERFKVRGYPTMILFSPAGEEITRLPGEVDPLRYMQVLKLGMNAARPVKALLAAAQTPGAKLNANDWRLLADYSWDGDEEQLLPKTQRTATLLKLAEAVPPLVPEIAVRFKLKALAAAAGEANAPALDRAAMRTLVLNALDDRAMSRDNFDVLVGSAPDLVRLLSTAGSPERAALTQALDGALRKLADDATLSTADRLQAVAAQVALARLDAQPDAKLPPTLQAEVRQRVKDADTRTTNGFERQSVITSAAQLLTDVGLMSESDALLTAELKRSHSPYYHMLGLAANARARGDKATAIHWYAEAWKASVGPATRLQWGSTYVRSLIDLVPEDSARIEAAGRAVLAELPATPAPFEGRNRAALNRLLAKLADWSKNADNAQVAQGLRGQVAAVCKALPEEDAQRAVCEEMVKPPQKS